MDERMFHAMVAADDAEARGDVGTALSIIGAHPVGPDGRIFWRPSRVVRLQQFSLLEPVLPRWATSRWILAQASQMLEPSARGLCGRALDKAIEVRGGPTTLRGMDDVDARCKVIDHDWTYRQLHLYEYGGLDVFLRRQATPDLLAGADHIREWSRAPMRALRLVERCGGRLVWTDLSTEEQASVLDLGGAALVLPGECVLGRVVPVEGDALLEGRPLRVPEDVGLDVARDPSDWVAALARGVARPRSAEDCLRLDVRDGDDPLTDVPTKIWVWVALSHVGGAHPPRTDEELDQLVLDFVRAGARGQLEERPDDVDPWPCVAAALLSPMVLGRLEEVAESVSEAELLGLADRLAGPAAAVCRGLAGEAEAA